MLALQIKSFSCHCYIALLGRNKRQCALYHFKMDSNRRIGIHYLQRLSFIHISGGSQVVSQTSHGSLFTRILTKHIKTIQERNLEKQLTILLWAYYFSINQWRTTTCIQVVDAMLHLTFVITKEGLLQWLCWLLRCMVSYRSEFTKYKMCYRVSI